MRDIWSYNRLSLRDTETDVMMYYEPRPEYRHINFGKAFVFTPENHERKNEIFNWCVNNLSDYLISKDIKSELDFIIWIVDIKEVVLFKLTHVVENEFSSFHDQMRILGLFE